MTENLALIQKPIRLTEKQWQDLEAISIAYGNIKKSNLVRMAVAEFIWKHKDLI